MVFFEIFKASFKTFSGIAERRKQIDTIISYTYNSKIISNRISFTVLLVFKF